MIRGRIPAPQSLEFLLTKIVKFTKYIAESINKTTNYNFISI